MAHKPRKDVERRIHFYRADCGLLPNKKPVPFQPKSAFDHIGKLKFDSFGEHGGRYLEDGENVYCCWPESASRAQFAVIRRDALPSIEEKGLRKALSLNGTAGLVESIHVRVFPDNIVGFDFNFYGPRLPRLGAYLNTVAEGAGPDVSFGPLLRSDAVKDLENGKELRMLSLRVLRSHVNVVKEVNETLGDGFDALKSVSEADELEIVLKPKPYSKEAIGGSGLLNAVRKLAKRPDVREVAKAFQVQVAGASGLPAQTLDLLGDHFIVDTKILKLNPKGRALNTEDAFAKIEQAFKARESELKKASALV